MYHIHYIFFIYLGNYSYEVRTDFFNLQIQIVQKHTSLIIMTIGGHKGEKGLPPPPMGLENTVKLLFLISQLLLLQKEH